MEKSEILKLCGNHTMYTWSAGAKKKPLVVTRAEGVYFWTADGHRMLDLHSQALSVHIGHAHPHVVQAMKDAADELHYCLPGFATEARARIGVQLASMLPEPLNSFFFTLGGSDANENALRMARLYTGRNKVMSRYRSYHGATQATLALGGDPRGQHVPSATDVIHVFDLHPFGYRFGGDAEETTANYLAYLEEVIRMEGPEKIAAFFLEVIPGTNGVLIPPAGYLKQLKSMLDRYGILLVCDEVMSGFGRTGKMFAFEHHDVVPDLVTLAKGLSSSYVPLGAVAVSDKIAQHFKDNVYWGGLTYNSHAFCLRVANAVLEVMVEEKLCENSAIQGAVLGSALEQMKRHGCVHEVRSVGLFGSIEFDHELMPNASMTPNSSSSAASSGLVKALRDRGVSCLIRYNNMLIAPPLCISQEQLSGALSEIDQAISAM